MSNIKREGYYDTPLWGKTVNENGEEVESLLFPVTRYKNIVGRPAVVTDMNDIIPTDMALLKVSEDEIGDDVIYELTGQIW